MNCKPGDLAVNIGGLLHCRGLIYTVLRYYDKETYADLGPAWFVDYRGREIHVLDAHLRPIRDPRDDAVDEFLALTGKPDHKQKIAEKMKERV